MHVVRVLVEGVMEDEELLELAAKAAKAAGEHISWATTGKYCFIGNDIWLPLDAGGDALRLATKLGISIVMGTYKVACEVIPQEDDNNICVTESYGDDADAAVRRAIVRAAAEIGRNL